MIEQLYHHQGNLYKILRRIRHNTFPNTDYVKEFRDLINGCDHVLKDPTHYLFCETVQEAEVVEYL